MATKEIEELLYRELRERCITCRHASTCIYRIEAKQLIIQCELYEDDAGTNGPQMWLGLCKTCDHALRCTLPEKTSGVWHCNSYV